VTSNTRSTETKRDIVDRLRWTWADHGQGYNSEYTADLMEAAEEIERLREMLAERAADETPACPHNEWTLTCKVCGVIHPAVGPIHDTGAKQRAADTSSGVA
jgi:hypothetical protein